MQPLCGLLPLAPVLHLWSLMTVRSHAMIGHFLLHYARLGIRLSTNAHVVLHEDYADGDIVLAAKQACEAHGVLDVQVQPSLNTTYLEGQKLWRLNAFIRSLPKQSWLVFADVDEFFSFPCDIMLRLKRRQTQTHAACAFMHDRVAADYALHDVRETPSIEEQFPVCTRLRKNNNGPIVANTLKLVLVRTFINGGFIRYLSAHRVATNRSTGMNFQMGGYPQKDNYCTFLADFSFAHYTWTIVSHRLAHRKVTDGELPQVYEKVLRVTKPCQTSVGHGLCFSSAAIAHINKTLVPCPASASACPACREGAEERAATTSQPVASSRQHNKVRDKVRV